MKPFHRSFLLQTATLYCVVIFSNILVDLLADGNLARMTGKPLLFFGGGLVLSAIGGFVIAKIMEKSGKEQR